MPLELCYGEEEKEDVKSEKCILCSGRREFVAEKERLCAKSVYFKTLFQSQMKESISNRVILNDMSPNALEIMLNFIETERLDDVLNEDHLFELVTSSHMFMLDELHEQCCSRIEITEDNYSQVATFRETYQTLTLKRKIANFQAKNFRNMRSEILRSPPDHMELLLSSTEIDATLDEIIEILLSWGKNKDEHILYLPRLMTFVNMSSMTERSFDNYLNNESLIKSNRDLQRTFLETASVFQAHFTWVVRNEQRAYSFKNNAFTSVKLLPAECLIGCYKLFYADHIYYALNKHKKYPFKTEIITFDEDGYRISRKIVDIDIRSRIVFIDDSLYIINCDIISQQTTTSFVFSFRLCSYNFADRRLKQLTSKQLSGSGGVLSVTSSETSIFILVPNRIYSVEIHTREWSKIDIPVSCNYQYSKLNNKILRYFDCLYLFHLVEEAPLDSSQTQGLEAGKSRCGARQMQVFRYLPDDTWQEVSVHQDFPHRFLRPLHVPLLKNRRLPVTYFVSWDSVSFLAVQFDFRNNEWTETRIDLANDWKALWFVELRLRVRAE